MTTLDATCNISRRVASAVIALAMSMTQTTSVASAQSSTMAPSNPVPVRRALAAVQPGQPAQSGAAASGAPEASPAPSTQNRGLNLTPTARDIAQQLDLMPLLEQIAAYQARSSLDLRDEIELLKLKQRLHSKLFVAALQVRDATARIERELAMINRMRGVLEDKRDRAIKLNSMENVAASGAMGEVAQAGSLFRNEVPGEVIGLVAGAATIGLGTWALRQQTGAKQRVSIKPNMLTEIFNFQADRESTYPAVIWNYLNRAPVGETKTRLQLLIERWQRFKVIPVNLKGPEAQKRIGILSNTRHNGTVNIDTFNDQADMLLDIKSEIFQMDKDLLELMQCLQLD
ncbi:MAG: hypothetical protein U0105_05490 [Candidatus Obscuribacterales bacterium]